MSRIALRPYQEADIRRAIEEFDGRVMLTHVPGSGKTVMSTRICEGLLPCVILCPAFLILQWIFHLQKEYPGCRIGTVVTKTRNGNWRASTKAEKYEMLSASVGTYDFYVLTYATIRRVRKTKDRHEAKGSRTVQEIWNDGIAEEGWLDGMKPKPKRIATEYPLPPCKSLIVEESHQCRGRKSQQFSGAYQLAVSTKARKAADRVVLLTASPIWTEPDDLYAQFRLLHPERFTSYWAFLDKFCLTESTDFGTKVVGGKTKRIAKLMEEYTIHRDYSDPEVALAVPELVETEIWSWLTPSSTKETESAISKMALDRRAGIGVGSGIAALSKITMHDKNKLSDLTELIESLRGDYALFTWYQDSAKLCAARFGLPLFTGSEGATRFTRGEAIKKVGSFCATLASVREGIDLSHLRNMVFVEVTQSPGGMEQVRRRLLRLRKDQSTDPVHCFYVLACVTIDEVSFEAQKQRGASIAEIADELIRRQVAGAQKV